jgi:hypothetical protein
MAIIAQPQWIAKMYEPKKGRDHLDLGSVSSDQILPRLSPGINVLTIYPRYHSFYTFLLDEFWQRDRARSWSSWGQFFRPRDFIFSLGVFLCDQQEHEEGIAAVGSQKTSPLPNSVKKPMIPVPIISKVIWAATAFTTAP